MWSHQVFQLYFVVMHFTALKMSVFAVFSGQYLLPSNWIRTCTQKIFVFVWVQQNMNQKNSKYGHSSGSFSPSKIPKFYLISWRGIFWKGTVFVEFRTVHPKLCGNCSIPQNFNTRKSGEISVFYAVIYFEHLYKYPWQATGTP